MLARLSLQRTYIAVHIRMYFDDLIVIKRRYYLFNNRVKIGLFNILV